MEWLRMRSDGVRMCSVLKFYSEASSGIGNKTRDERLADKCNVLVATRVSLSARNARLAFRFGSKRGGWTTRWPHGLGGLLEISDVLHKIDGQLIGLARF